MKKSLNKLILIALITLIQTPILSIFALAVDPHPFPLVDSSTVLPFLFNFLAGFIYTLVLIVFVLAIPAIIAAVELIFQITARLFQIGNEQKWKNICSIIFTMLAIMLQICLTNLLIFNTFVFSHFIAIPTIHAIAFDVLDIKEFAKLINEPKAKIILIPTLIIVSMIISALFFFLF